ncbi:uncharacterized protein LOC129567524 isoform X2 [Sitodiplosis mosellana]|nr:uncharacterized protein LOC129567524 isoform X2 [Sitodiplosis mosellana]
MRPSFSSLLYKFNSTKWLAFPLHRKYCVNNVVTNNGTRNKSIHRNFNYMMNPLEEIMNTVPPESEALSPDDTLNIWRQLGDASRAISSSSTASFNIVEHTNFAILRRAMKVSMPYFKTTDQFDILKAIQTLSVPTNDDVYDTILSSLLDNVYSMSLNDIMVMDSFFVSKQTNPLARELHHTLIDRFNAKTSQFPVEFNYFVKVRRMLQFIGRNRQKIIDEAFENIRNCAIKREIDIFTANESMKIIITLSHFGDKCEYFQPVLDKAFDVWSTSNVTIRMVETVLTFLNKRIQTLNRLYRDTRLIEKCARVVIENGDLEKCFIIQQQFNRLEFSSKQLIDFLLRNLSDTAVKENFVRNSMKICIACDVANYRPPLFEDLLPTLATMNFHQQLDIRLNWPKFALRLNSLGIYHEPLIQEILKRRSYFESFDKSSMQDLENLHMNKLVNAAPLCN